MALRLDTSWSISSCVPRTGMRADRSPSMMARLVRVMVSMRRRKLVPISRAAGDGEQQRKPARPGEGAHDGVLHLDQAVGVLRHQQERAVGQGEAEAGELGRRGVGLGRVGLGHEIDDAVDRRHAGQIADHDPAVGRLQQIEDRTAGAEVHAPRDLLGEARQAAAAVDLGQLEGLGAQHGRHVGLHRRRRRPVDGDEQRAGRQHEQHGIDQRQPEARRAQDPDELPMCPNRARERHSLPP